MTKTGEDELTSETEMLEQSFPFGMFDGRGGLGQENGLRSLRIIEKIILETSRQNAQYARFSLLQSFPRFLDHEGHAKSEEDVIRLATKDFVRRYCSALSPAWYEEVLTSLSDAEVEVFLKNSLHAHEQWGHKHGVCLMVRSMMESCLHETVAVEVHDLAGEERAIPEGLHSRLGRKESYSFLGRNFLIGRRVESRPETYDISIGPITTPQLEALQRAGWADGTRVTEKLSRLVEMTEPFYMRGKLRFLFERVGFVLGRVSAGRGRLGIVAQAQA